MIGFRKIFITFARAMFYGAMVLLVLAAGGLLALQTAPVREMAIRFIEEAVSENTRSVCRIENLRGSLISRFEIDGLELKAADTGHLLVSAEKIMASYSIPMLLSRTVWVNRLNISGANVNLTQTRDGAWNFEALGPETLEKAGLPETVSTDSGFQRFNINLRRLEIKNSDIFLRQPSDTGESVCSFKNINCSARLEVGNAIAADIRHLAVQVSMPELNLKDVAGRVRFEPEKNQLLFDNLQVVGAQSDFTVNGLVAMAPSAPETPVLDTVILDLSADIAKMSLGEFGRAFPITMPDADVVSGDIAVKGPVSKMDCQVDLTMDQLHVKSRGQVTIDAAYDVGLDISGRIGKLDLAALPLLNLNFLPGRLSGDFSLFWQKIGASAQFGDILLNLDASTLRDYRIDKADIDVRIDGPDFVFDKIYLKTPFGRLDGSGAVAGFMDSAQDNRVALLADIENLTPEVLIPKELRKGNRFSGKVSGCVDASWFIPKTFLPEEMAADVECRLNPSTIMTIEVLRAYGKAALQNQEIRVHGLEVETAQGTAEAAGRVFLSDETWDMKISAMVPEMENVAHWIGYPAEAAPLCGSMSVAADITGNWQKPMVRAELDGREIRFQDIFLGSLRVDGFWEGDFQDFSATMEGAAKNSGRQDLLIPELNFKTALTPQSLGADLDMTGDQIESLALSGEIENWQNPVRTAVINRLYLKAVDQPAVVNRQPALLTFSSEQIKIEKLVLDSGNGSLLVDGETGTAPADSVAAAILLKNFDLDRISGFFAWGETVQGQVSADMVISGSLAAPVIRLSGDIASGGYGKWGAAADAEFKCVYEGGEIQAEGVVSREAKQIMNISGSVGAEVSFVPFAAHLTSDSLAAEMRLDQVDVFWISEMIRHPEYGLSGNLNAAATLSGDFFYPDIQGQVWLDNGALHLKKQGLVYETVSADVRFSKDAVTIKKMRIAGDKEGALSLSGSVTHNHFRPRRFDLRATGERLYVPFHSGVDARIDPELSLTGTWAAPVLSGNIHVPEGRVNLERFLKKEFSEIEVVAPVRAENGVLKIPEKEPESLAFVDPLAADVQVVIPKDFWFRGKDEFIEIKGNVNLKKAPYKPFVLYGSVLPVRGTYRFRGRVFQITEGELVFTGQEDINPFVDVRAEHSIDNVKIIIQLSGTFEHINMDLSSEPAMDQSAIIAYLIFGRSPDDLSEKESFQAAEAALSFTGQIAADTLRDLVGDTLGIDYLSIDAGSGGLRQGSLTMGKYVLPKVFVTFRQGFDETVTQKVEVTYEINKNFELETRIDNEQTSAVDLIWKFDY